VRALVVHCTIIRSVLARVERLISLLGEIECGSGLALGRIRSEALGVRTADLRFHLLVD
jgi:hypothetical protein